MHFLWVNDYDTAVSRMHAGEALTSCSFTRNNSRKNLLSGWLRVATGRRIQGIMYVNLYVYGSYVMCDIRSLCACAFTARWFIQRREISKTLQAREIRIFRERHRRQEHKNSPHNIMIQIFSRLKLVRSSTLGILMIVNY